MSIYLLVPLHTTEPAWRDARRREPVQVIAESEQAARATACSRYGSAVKSDDDPWLLARWVYAHVIDQADRTLPLLKCPETPGVQTTPQ